MLYRLLAQADRSNLQSCVVSLVSGGYFADRLRGFGVPVHGLGMQSGTPNPLAVWRLRKVVKGFGPAVIHSWMYHAALLALVSLPERCNVIGIHHALHDLRGERFLTARVIAGLARMSSRAARVVYCSAASRAQHEAIGYADSRATVIPNGFDCDVFQPMEQARIEVREGLGLPSNAFVVGHVGRYHPTKDHELLIAAFGKALQSVQHAYLVLVGAGVTQENEELRARVSRAGLESRVYLLGERDDVPRLLNAFDVLVSSSRSEAFPTSVGEAMASGVPCVVTDVGDSARIVGDAGWVVPSRDIDRLASAILESSELAPAARALLSARARSRIMEHFSLARSIDAYAELYQSVGL